MRITVRWLPPVDLFDGAAENLIYSCNLDELPDTAGVYVFARCFGESVSPLYVGQARSIRGRIKQQFNNTRLMKGIENAKIGPRVLLLAEVSTRLVSHLERSLNIVERTLIEHYLSENFDLINIQGTNIPADTVEFEGNNLGRQTCPRVVVVPKRRNGVMR